MGERLIKYYDWIAKEGGLKMKMRLAMKTSLPSDKAKTAPDDMATLNKFHMAVKEISGKESPKF